MKQITIILIGVLWAGVATACSLVQGSPPTLSASENYDDFAMVAVVTIIDTQESESYMGNSYTFRVNEQYKGDLEDMHYVSSPGHSCGFFGSVGQTFIWMTNDSDEIDELDPKYFFNTVAEAITAGDNDFLHMSNPEANQDDPSDGQVFCTKEYRPVCADLQVQCITEPCYPIRGTYPNACEARAAGASIVANKQCSYEGPIRRLPESSNKDLQPTEVTINTGTTTGEKDIVTQAYNGPSIDPVLDMREPTTPPPSRQDESIQNLITDSAQPNWWDRFTAWITSLW